MQKRKKLRTCAHGTLASSALYISSDSKVLSVEQLEVYKRHEDVRILDNPRPEKQLTCLQKSIFVDFRTLAIF